MQDEPGELDLLFSRGIDPDVEDPNKCHDHPAVPPSWPAKPDIVAYVRQVGCPACAAAVGCICELHGRS